jgi:hypothetical protein
MVAPMATPQATPKMRRAGVLAKSSVSSTRAWCDDPADAASNAASPTTYAGSRNRSRCSASPISAVMPRSACPRNGAGRSPRAWAARRSPSGVEVDQLLVDAVELAGVDGEPRTRTVDAQVVHSSQPAQQADRLRGLDLDGRARQVAEVVECSRLGGLAGADDRDAIAECFDLGKDVAGQCGPLRSGPSARDRREPASVRTA